MTERITPDRVREGIDDMPDWAQCTFLTNLAAQMEETDDRVARLEAENGRLREALTVISSAEPGIEIAGVKFACPQCSRFIKRASRTIAPTTPE